MRCLGIPLSQRPPDHLVHSIQLRRYGHARKEPAYYRWEVGQCEATDDMAQPGQWLADWRGGIGGVAERAIEDISGF